MTDPDFAAEGKAVNDEHWRETPAYIAMMGVKRGYAAGMEAAANVADDNRTDDDSMWDRAAATIARAIRADAQRDEQTGDGA